MTIEDANPAAEALLQAPVEALAGRPLSRALDEACMDRLREAVEEGRLDDLEPIETVVEAGEAQAFDVVFAPVGDGTFWICRLTSARELDCARLRAAEQARLAAEEAARESLAELARAARMITVATFAASIAHEVNQPVSAIMANSDAALRWLSKSPPNLDEARAALERIKRDAERTSAVVGRTRGMLTKDLGRRQSTDLHQLLREALLFTELQRKRGAIKVETVFAGDLPAVWADPVQIQQVAVNLIANAIDAMKGVSGRRRVLRISTSVPEPGLVRIAVADNGAGVDDGDVAKIFTNLFTTKPDGMGLGLSICKAIVEAHGGRLDMTANEPFGAVFSFTLPTRESA